jgi:group I intron endonuclease
MAMASPTKFKLEILEYCDPKDVISREQYYLDLLKPQYNILKNAYSSLGYKHSAESLAKISARALGRIFSEEHKTKLSEALKGKPRPSGSGKPSQQIEVTDIKNNTTITYNSISEAARALNFPPAMISMYFKRNQVKPSKGRYIFTKL